MPPAKTAAKTAANARPLFEAIVCDTTSPKMMARTWFHIIGAQPSEQHVRLVKSGRKVRLVIESANVSLECPVEVDGWSIDGDDGWLDCVLRVTDASGATATFGASSGDGLLPRKKWFRGASAPPDAERYRFLVPVDALVGLRDALAALD